MGFGTTLHHETTPNPLFFGRMSTLALTACVGLLVGVSSAAEKTVDASAHLDPSALHLETPDARLSIATMDTGHGLMDSKISSSLIVRTADPATLAGLVEAIAQRIPGVHIGRVLDDDGHLVAIDTPSVSLALKVRKMMQGQAGVESVMLDQSTPMPHIYNTQGARRNTGQDVGIGIKAIPHDEPGRGGSGDPFGEWHLQNTGASFPGNDNHIPPSVYDTMGITGLGVSVGVSNLGYNNHIDVDHADLILNYSPALTQPFDPNLLGDAPFLTGWTGLVSAERDNGVGGQGVAPGATISTFNWNETGLTEFEAYDWKLQDIDIKAFFVGSANVIPQSGYNNLRGLTYIMDSLKNSYRFGRGRKSVINVFGTGAFNGVGIGPKIFLPDPYNFPPAGGDTFSPIDELAATGNIVSDGVTNGWTGGPYYVTGNTNNYPPAAERRSLIINTVAEDGNYDIYSANGTSIFASVYGGTNNVDQGGGPGFAVRSVLTTTPGSAGNIALLPLDATSALTSADMTGTTIASGIIALMLEANPNLTMRDIQHILFESIQDSTKSAAIKWPNFDTTRSYYSPFAQGARRSFWEVNNGFYTSDTVTLQAIRHSDEYGFGVIDGELAVQKAAAWQGSGPLIVLDSTGIGDFNDGTAAVADLAARVPLDIPDATFFVGLEADGTLGVDGFANLIPGIPVAINFCVRQNISIESVVAELTISGLGSNDLLIELFSPTGTRSILAMPTTINPSGTAQTLNGFDDDVDLAFTSGIFNGTDYAYYQHPFLSWKYWGELSGGVWQLRFTDYGPDAITPQGVAPSTTGSPPDPGADVVTDLGEIGVPGSTFRSMKTVQAFHIKIYGTDTGVPVFQGCQPIFSSCPADLDGNGVVALLDLEIYISWYLSGNALADMNGDGVIGFDDLLIFRTLWQPGFCEGSTGPFVGGRPRPGGTDGGGGDNDPIIHPF